jgi:hypothetical protein
MSARHGGTAARAGGQGREPRGKGLRRVALAAPRSDHGCRRLRRRAGRHCRATAERADHEAPPRAVRPPSAIGAVGLAGAALLARSFGLRGTARVALGGGLGLGIGTGLDVRANGWRA